MIFALHYFLWFSALTPIYGYLSVYAKNYANVSPQTYGILNMWLPFMSMVAKPVFCSLADHYQAYRTFFILFLGLALFGWGSFGVLPFFIEKPPNDDPNGLNVLNWTLICIMTFAAYLSMSVICCLSDAFAVNQAKKTGTSYGKIRVWGTLGWGISAFFVAYINEYNYLPILVPGLLLTIFCLLLDLIIVILWRDRSTFKLDKPIADIDNDDNNDDTSTARPTLDHCLNDCNNKAATMSVANKLTIVVSNDVDFGSPIDNSGDIQNCNDRVLEKNQSGQIEVQQQTKSAESYMPNRNRLSNISSMLPPSYESLNYYTVNTDMTQHINYPLSSISSNNQTKTIYGTINNANKKKIISLRLQMLMLYMVINTRRSLIRFMVLFTLAGLLMSMQWVYFFYYLEEIYQDNFTYISSLSMVGQSFLGELPFFIISQKIIDTIGRSNALSLSIASIAVRYLLYIYLLPYVSMYFVILVEALQGPSFGLFYVVMTGIGMDYSDCEVVILKLIDSNHIENNPDDIQLSRRALRATMQGLVSGCFEGLGLGLGSVIGGYVINKLGFQYLWVGSAILALSSALVNFLIDFKNR